MADPMDPGPDGGSWERKWRERPASEFAWHTDAPPPELSRLLESGALPPGAALDLGCGDGIAAQRMARALTPTTGVDVAMGAARRARQLAREAGVAPSFVVAEAPSLPFRDGAFALIFDRGCLQNVARPLWPAYFREAERLLGPGGLLQVFVVRPTLPPVLSARGVRARLRHPRRAFRTQRKRTRLFDRRFRGLLPASLEVREMGEALVAHGTRRRVIVHLLARKTSR